jgi:hypothetical protein
VRTGNVLDPSRYEDPFVQQPRFFEISALKSLRKGWDNKTKNGENSWDIDRRN